MKKTIILALVTFLTFATSFKAQAIEDPYSTGTFIGSAHLGLVPGIGTNVSGDYVVFDNLWIGHLTAGAYLGYTYRFGNAFYHTPSSKYLDLLGRVTYGVNLNDLIEVHLGIMLGPDWRFGKMNYVDDTHYDKFSDLHFAIGAVTGARVRLVDNLFASAEVNFVHPISITYITTPISMNTINIGISYVF